MAAVFDTYLAYKFIKILTTPWNKMPAYSLGIVDENGTQLKKTKDLTSQKEKNEYTIFHRIIFNLKRILEKFPMGRSRIASYSAAFFLIREERDKNIDVDSEIFDLLENYLIDYINQLENKSRDLMVEAAPVNSIGDASHLAGLGKNPPARFAGMPVFRVKSSTYANLLHGKKKYARWEKYISSEEASDIRKYIKTNPKNPVVLMDAEYGTMTILRRHNEI